MSVLIFFNVTGLKYYSENNRPQYNEISDAQSKPLDINFTFVVRRE